MSKGCMQILNNIRIIKNQYKKYIYCRKIEKERKEILSDMNEK